MKKQILVCLVLVALLSSVPSVWAAEGDYTGEHWDTEAQDAGIATDGTNIWTVSYGEDRVYKYTMAGVFIGSWDISGQSDSADGVTTDGTNIWVVDDGFAGDEVYKYTMAGVYIDLWDISGQSGDSRGIVTDGTNIWVVDQYDKEVYKYTMAGGYIDSWDTSGQSSNPHGIATDGNYILIVDSTDEEVYKYTMAGVYTDEHWDTSGQTATPYDIATDGTNFWIVDFPGRAVYKYEGPSAPSTFDDVFGPVPALLNEIIAPLVGVVAILVALKVADQIFDTGNIPDMMSVFSDLSQPTVIMIAVVIMLLILLAGINI